MSVRVNFWNPAAVASINQGIAPVREPGLDQMMRRNASRLRATTDVREAVLRSEITFVVVPTPSGADGTFSMQFVLNAAEKIALALPGEGGEIEDQNGHAVEKIRDGDLRRR